MFSNLKQNQRLSYAMLLVAQKATELGIEQRFTAVDLSLWDTGLEGSTRYTNLARLVEMGILATAGDDYDEQGRVQYWMPQSGYECYVKLIERLDPTQKLRNKKSSLSSNKPIDQRKLAINKRSKTPVNCG